MHLQRCVKIMVVEFRCFKFISDGGDPDEWKKNVSKGSVLFANKLKQIREEEMK
jgi:hypothetical protein